MTPFDTPPDGSAGDAPRPLHPFTLLFATITVARGFLLPAIIGGLSASRAAPGEAAQWIVALLAIPALMAAVAKYTTFRYRLGAEELIINSGVLGRRARIIPFNRVQNIEVRQNLFQRLLGVVELRVETAGSGQTEAVLSVLGEDDGIVLRRDLLARRDARREPAIAAEQSGAVTETEAPHQPVGEAAPRVALAQLSPRDLVVAGATANEAGLIAATIAGATQLFDEMLPPLIERVPWLDWIGGETTVLGIAWLIAGALALLLLVGWVVSIVSSVVGYHDFTLERVGNELHKRYGLLSRRDTHVPLRRVQAIRIEESILRRPLGLAALKIETAGGIPGRDGRGGAEAFLPIARIAEVPGLLTGVFDDLAFTAIELHPVHPRSRRRAFTRYAVVVLVAAAALTVFVEARWAALLLLLVPAWLLADAQYRHRGWGLAPGYVVARAGVFNRVTWIVPDRKLQTLHLEETPFQRRHGLATLVADTAAGGRVARVIDLARSDAVALFAALGRRAIVGARTIEPAAR